MLAEFGTILCSSTNIYESIVESLINNVKDGQNKPLVLILGSYHKRGFVEILDPSSSKDPSAFDKCYWLVYFSVQGFLKTIKDEKETTKNIIEDIVNKNSKGLKKKIRKKSIHTDIPYCQSSLIPDVTFLRPSISFLPSPCPDFPTQVEDIVNKSSEGQRRRYQDNFQNLLFYIPLSTYGIISIQRSFQEPYLTPPQLPVEVEVISDSLNYPQPQHTSCDPTPHWPDLTYPIPPLIDNIDIRTEILPFILAPSPFTEDTINIPQPVTARHYFDDQDAGCVMVIQESEGGPCVQASPLSIHLSPPSSPSLPRLDPDTVNNTPMIRSHQILLHPISPPVFFPPGDDDNEKKSFRLNFERQPPQQALYLIIDDSYSMNLSYGKRVSCAHISSFVFYKRPTIIHKENRVESNLCRLSPPQSPLMPMRRESKVEDLFDQVRRHSRGVNFYR